MRGVNQKFEIMFKLQLWQYNLTSVLDRFDLQMLAIYLKYKFGFEVTMNYKSKTNL